MQRIRKILRVVGLLGLTYIITSFYGINKESVLPLSFKGTYKGFVMYEVDDNSFGYEFDQINIKVLNGKATIFFGHGIPDIKNIPVEKINKIWVFDDSISNSYLKIRSYKVELMYQKGTESWSVLALSKEYH